jgi:small subunit ribosomal protein S6
MNNYELLYIVSNQYTENELISIKEKVNGLLTKYDAQLGFTESLGKKKLSYPIDKVNHGYYIVAEFELLDGSALAKINNDLKLDKEVLRAQIISKSKITKEEIERQNRQRAKQAEMAKNAPDDSSEDTRKPFHKKVRPSTPAPAKPAEKIEDTKPVDMKKLDEKLDEILKDDTII